MYVRSCIRFLLDCTTTAMTHDAVNQWCAVQKRVGIECLVAERESQWETSTNTCAVFVEVLWSTEAPLVTWWRVWRLPKQEEKNSLICLAQAVLSQRAGAIVCEDQCVTAWQLAFSLSVSKGSVRHIVRDLGYLKACARWFSQSPTVATQNRE
jgi:hypothetical protein